MLFTTANKDLPCASVGFLKDTTTGDQELQELARWTKSPKSSPSCKLLQQQQKETSDKFLRMLEKMEARMAGTVPIVVKDKHSVFESLYRRIEKFTFDADNGRTFDVWYKRFKDVFGNDCGDLDNKEKTRLLVSRLDEDCHQLFCGSFSPKLPSELTWDEAIATLERLFGSAKTLFRPRFECFKIQYKHQDFNAYETLVRTRYTKAKLDSIDFDGLQCLVYVSEFQGTGFADYRTCLLRRLDQAGKLLIKDLTAESQLIKSYKEDAKMLENAAIPALSVYYNTWGKGNPDATSGIRRKVKTTVSAKSQCHLNNLD